jgi:D-glycero-D-manno-heptose 1,7-bisphosphate phosphatase
MTAASTAFIDRDGVINRKPPDGRYVLQPEELDLLPGAPEAIARLSHAGLRTVIVTNQQGVGKGLLSIDRLSEIHDLVAAAVKAEGGRLDQVLVCPHLEGTCECRKPNVGLFLEARRRDPSIRLDRSVVIGDSDSDMEAAAAIGARGLRVCADPGSYTGADTVVGLPAAAELILDGDR